ncbi:MAG: flagellar export chaperone FliS [Spirochaetes bacterium]|nr:flagellar export chaperone FliS [Spirochaetota bacterium]
MSINNPYKQYKTTQISSANQSKLILMLYDGAIKFINKAIELMPTKSIEEVHKNILKAQDIIVELTTSLNMEAGEISKRLLNIYMYINNRLTDANIQKKTKPLLEVKKYLLELRGAWEEAGKKSPSEINEIKKGGINIAT